MCGCDWGRVDSRDDEHRSCDGNPTLASYAGAGGFGAAGSEHLIGASGDRSNDGDTADWNRGGNSSVPPTGSILSRTISFASSCCAGARFVASGLFGGDSSFFGRGTFLLFLGSAKSVAFLSGFQPLVGVRNQLDHDQLHRFCPPDAGRLRPLF